MRLKRLITTTLATVNSTIRMGSITSGRRILMYHAIGTPVDGDSYGIFSLDPDKFDQHMRLLAKLRDAGKIRVSQLGNQCDYKSDLDVVITFDDGYRDNYLVAHPILEKYSLPYTIFVTSGFVNDSASKFLTSSDLRILSRSQIAQIGAHGKSHSRLTTLSDNELEVELVESKKFYSQIGRAHV